jgi:hypothetical protein
MDVPRRDFLKVAALAAAPPASLPPSCIVVEDASTPLRKLASRELLRGLLRLLPLARVRFGAAAPGAPVFHLLVEPASFQSPESYRIARAGSTVTLTGASERALLYSVFDFLERQGAFFGIDGESYPLERPASLALPPDDAPWQASPRFHVRGLLPWPDFLNCITVYNDEDFRAYFEAMLRMRFNTFGMHVYTGAGQWAESYLSYEFAGAGHLAFLDTSATQRWGYLPRRTSTFSMGASQFYDSEVFGSEATRLGRDPWEIAARTRALLRPALAHAGRLGISTGIGFEPYQIPDEIFRALPPEIKPKPLSRGAARFDIESFTAKRMLETRLGQLLDAYPGVDHVWLWEDEGMSWESQRTQVPLSATPFLQAHDFLRRHAPNKRLVLAGWGGVARHFDHFHRLLPGDVVFSCLNDMTGWDPVSEVFGRLEGRERWPIPWLEDDPGMWLPQFHVHRFERDMNLAEQYGCQGLIGIHWRHRIVDPTAGFQARFSWDKSLTPESYYRAHAASQAAPARSAPLARTLFETDRDRRILSTGTGDIRNNHQVTRAYSGDYSEAFEFWRNQDPSSSLIDTQKAAAAALSALVAQASTPAERERLAYLAGHVDFLVPYTDAWILAHRTQLVLDQAARLVQEKRPADARDRVRAEAVPVWLELAPKVRQAILAFQNIVATRNDLGTLASMHDKFARLALVRLRMSIEEYLGEISPDMQKAYGQAASETGAVAQRVFLPTRPTFLARGEKVRLLIVAPGPADLTAVTLHVRPHLAPAFTSHPARLLGRRTWEAWLGPFPPPAPLVEYYVSAQAGTARLTAPPGAPEVSCRLTLV